MREGARTVGIKVHARPTCAPPPAMPTLLHIPLAQRKNGTENIADEVDSGMRLEMEALNEYQAEPVVVRQNAPECPWN